MLNYLFSAIKTALECENLDFRLYFQYEVQSLISFINQASLYCSTF